MRRSGRTLRGSTTETAQASLPAAEPRWAPLLAGAAAVAGLALRLAWPTRLPDGPWIDEVCAIRAARTLLSSKGWSLFGTSPIYPPEAGIPGAFEPNLYLLLTGLVDRLAGGGMASVRWLSVGFSVALFLAGLFLAAELLGRRSRGFAFAAVLLAGSGWALRLGRWGWMNLGTSALLVLSLALALRAVRTGRAGPAVGAGVALGLAQYGYLTSRVGLVFAVGALVLATWSWWLRRRWLPDGASASLRTALVVALGAIFVALPLFVHLAGAPAEATERMRTLTPAGGGAALPGAVARNVVELAGMFFGAGDPSPRHGEPGREIVPLPVAIAVLAGVAGALLAGGAARTTALAGLALLATNLPTRGGDDAANSFRVLAAASPLLVLGAWAFERVASEVERRLPRHGALVAYLVLAGVVATAALDAASFVRWGRDPATGGLFGGAERRLAERLRAHGAGLGTEVLVARRAADARTAIVEVLLGAPASSVRGVRLEVEGLDGPPPRIGFLPGKELIYLDLDLDPDPILDPGSEGASAGGVRPGTLLVERIPSDAGRPPFRLYRMSLDAARGAAAATLGRWPRHPAAPAGDLVLEEDGLCRIEEVSEGGTRGFLALLAAGRHASAGLLSPGARLAGFSGPDGYPRRLPP